MQTVCLDLSKMVMDKDVWETTKRELGLEKAEVVLLDAQLEL